MILVLGVGIVGQAVIKYFKNIKHNRNICFFDDKITFLPNVAFFTSTKEAWNKIELIVASPGVALKHDLMQEGMKRNIPIVNDISIFLNDYAKGIKIGVTGTVGKSSTCALLKHVLGPKASVGGNFGISPLFLPESDYYIIELSSYQLELMSKEDLAKLDIGIITNIYPNHLDRHGSFEDYISAKCKILSAKKNILGNCELFKDWQIPKISGSENLPNSKLFQRLEYKQHWSMVEHVFNELKLDVQQALYNAETYTILPFRQEIIAEKPIIIVNDSKSTNAMATLQACKNMNNEFCLLAGGVNLNDSALWSVLTEVQDKIKKVFLYNESVQLKQALDNLRIQHEYINNEEISNLEKFDLAVKKALGFSVKNKLDLLFSPGYQSFDAFQNFEQRGLRFNEIVKNYLDF